MKTTLKITSNGIPTFKPISLGDSVSIGRSSKCEFKLNDEKISSTHCRFYLKKDRLEIVDLKSKNGTYLNGIKIGNSEFYFGDVIKIGDTTITLDLNSTDSEAIKILSFRGTAKERMSHELKADFTGLRNQNQPKEVNSKKKGKITIKFSKHEIKARNKILSLISMCIDLGLLILILALLFSLKNIERLELVIIYIFSILAYGTLNFKMAKFTIGEKVTGIEKKYYHQ